MPLAGVPYGASRAANPDAVPALSCPDRYLFVTCPSIPRPKARALACMGVMGPGTTARARVAFLSVRLGPPARHMAPATKLPAATTASVIKVFAAVVSRTALAAAARSCCALPASPPDQRAGCALKPCRLFPRPHLPPFPCPCRCSVESNISQSMHRALRHR